MPLSSQQSRAPTAREVVRSNVIVARARARLSQEQLAERADVARPTISRIERAETDVGIDTLERIAAALAIPLSDLFVPASTKRLDDDELAARAADSDFIDARQFLAALDEANAEPSERYSRAGRPLAR